MVLSNKGKKGGVKMEKYNPTVIEKKWQSTWRNHPEISQAQSDSESSKFFCLDMFPYPSGLGLHVGHVENYTATDIYSRFLRMNGGNVLHPMGWDAFGLPAENYAIKHGIHPEISNAVNIKNFTSQMTNLGLLYDWSREINTSTPEYYRWTQWFFLLLYNHKLAYRGMSKVNWCNSCQTVLANEQAKDGVCDRCKTVVTQKYMEQWFFRVTEFIEDQEYEGRKIAGLINGLDNVDWPESTRKQQIEWIGKSVGVQFGMSIVGTDAVLEVFTTRIDTAFGIAYVVIAPENPLVYLIKSRIENFEDVMRYIQDAKLKSELERVEMSKTGIRLEGIEVINPFNQEKIQVFVADYVLGHYGTGAVMAVPAHDARDFEFAQRYNLAIRTVIESSINGEGNVCAKEVGGKAFTKDGILVNSGKYSGLTSVIAREIMALWIEENNIGKRRVNYKLRDWIISRQRYWGAPIPIIYCDECGEIPVAEIDLPIILPNDVNFQPTGESPLIHSETFHNVVCPMCGKKAKRESDTMDTFVCSSWYFLRFADPHNKVAFASQEAIKKWLPVDLYMGGAEHTVLHLIYARFFTKVLKKFGYVDFDEPFLKLRHQGMILGEDGQKISKSTGNAISPDDVVKKFGADTLRLYEMFMGPLEEMKVWSSSSVVGPRRFLEKVWKLQLKVDKRKMIMEKSLESLLHRTIKKVSNDIKEFRFNTAISALMILLNAMAKEDDISITVYESFIIMLFPFAPHITEEIWEKLGYAGGITKQTWPKWNEAICVEKIAVIAVLIDGKKKSTLNMAMDDSSDRTKVEALCLNDSKLNILKKRVIHNIIFVPGKIINFVITRKEDK